ncbi:MAG: Capsule biosynthesis protein CapA [Calditrichaeota bacterium]|nr:Capsule biosynthesis protein CapA [Calditrichota bacterium]
MRLTWTLPDDGAGRWLVLRSFDEFGVDEDTLGYTSDTTWFDPEGQNYPGERVFYRIAPWAPDAPPDDFVEIENFDEGPLNLLPFGVFDTDPDWSLEPGGPGGEEGQHLRLSGDTWKVMMLDEPIELNQEIIWSVDAMSDTTGRLQMFGLGDGSDEMWYVLWGLYAPNTDSLIWTYQGWYPQFEWQTFHLPVGEDWHGRFGSNPTIDRLFFVNDYENGVSDLGTLRIDNLRDATNAMPETPNIFFTWEWTDHPDPDSVAIEFHNWSLDFDSDDLSFMWSFGDGTFSRENNPAHVYPTGGEWPVTLRATDGWEYWDYRTEWIADEPVTQERGDFTITLVGDVILARGVQDHIDEIGEAIFDGVRDPIESAELAIGNLESPMTYSNDEHPTKGIVFKGRPEDTELVHGVGFDFVTIANNHILDYMESGMLETQESLDEYGVSWAGAGMNDVIARRPNFLNINRMTFAIVAMSNRDGHYNNYQPFLDAARDRPGFALWNRTGIEATVPALAESADLVMCNVHCGSEYSLIPMDGDAPGETPGLFEVGPDNPRVIFAMEPDSGEVALREYAIEQGADLVIAHHPHIIQALELYQGKLIAHSLGNFMFDLSYNETLATMLLQVHVGDGEVDEVKMIPGWIRNDLPLIPTGELARSIIDYVTHYSRMRNTELVRPPNEEVAYVQFDTTYAHDNAQGVRLVELEPSGGGQWRSRPIFLDWDGYVTRVGMINPPAGTIVRYGRDILHWANMESEGAQPWNINSQYEGYDGGVSYEGQRSLRIRLPDNVWDNYITDFRKRVKLQSERPHSFLAWLSTTSVSQANYQVRFYNTRGSDALFEAVPLTLTGNNDWTPVYEDFDQIPANWNFVNVRCNQEPPLSGWGTAWYDEMVFVEWQDWQEPDGAGQVHLPYPNGYRYVQVQIPEDQVPPDEQISLYYLREWPSFYQAPADIGGEGRVSAE